MSTEYHLGINVKKYGAIGDGIADDTAVIQKALDGGQRTVFIPPGIYKISATLKVDSHTYIKASPLAIIRLAEHAGVNKDVFLLTNRNFSEGNEGILVEGGIWDGNNPGNPRGADASDDSYTGVAINFVNVRDLNIRQLTVRDPESFFIRLGEVRTFVVEDVTLDAPHVRPNQDGVHIGGFCENGIIRRIKALGICCPNDDMVAINANDDVTRAINLGMKEGPIRRIVVEDIVAEDAYTFVRLLSQDAPIEDVHISKIRGGCRYHAINLNRWRFPPGKGDISQIRIENVKVARLPSSCKEALIHITLAVQDLEISGFIRQEDDHPEVASLDLANGITSQLLLEGLSTPQFQALECVSTTRIACEPASRFDGCSVRASISPGGRMRLPFGGFQHLRVRT
jgi:hypothetical protein